MQEYFGRVPYPEWDEHKALQVKYNKLKEDMDAMRQENIELEQKIEAEKERQ